MHAVVLFIAVLLSSAKKSRNKQLETQYKSHVRNMAPPVVRDDTCKRLLMVVEEVAVTMRSESRSRQALVHELLLDKTHPPLEGTSGLEVSSEVRGVREKRPQRVPLTLLGLSVCGSKTRSQSRKPVSCRICCRYDLMVSG